MEGIRRNEGLSSGLLVNVSKEKKLRFWHRNVAMESSCVVKSRKYRDGDAIVKESGTGMSNGGVNFDPATCNRRRNRVGLCLVYER